MACFIFSEDPYLGYRPWVEKLLLDFSAARIISLSSDFVERHCVTEWMKRFWWTLTLNEPVDGLFWLYFLQVEADFGSIHSVWDKQSTDHPWTCQCSSVFNLDCCYGTTADSRALSAGAQRNSQQSWQRLVFWCPDRSALRMFLILYFYVLYCI